MQLDGTLAYISLGSNLGDRAGNLLLAVRGLIEADLAVRRLSTIYETEPVGIDTDLKFLNMAAEVVVKDVKPSQMLARLLRIEYLLGRGDRPPGAKKPRTVDLDIIFFGSQVIDTEFLTVPHPRMHLRKFVLRPLAELIPNFVHPVLKTEVVELLAASEDRSAVHRWSPNAHTKGEAAA
ncbi:MAG: 2-amino-4-hydroxy-6- hydroxymethyldihydropteridine pyrophosphokinase [Acidobacteria bacterium OLB17]|nr:MAG: 2-amino-4-hydroxy-6- hydroxymethyldihydropteridine pyrophosphokinase [Acidobacteria bacterium OLB17]MCZ2391358.1 2-amino-4-hydroxy-6-hydroxymethyldihydropteridine diphosphokinase [Acidobacteriota bacterium]